VRDAIVRVAGVPRDVDVLAAGRDGQDGLVAEGQALCLARSAACSTSPAGSRVLGEHDDGVVVVQPGRIDGAVRRTASCGSFCALTFLHDADVPVGPQVTRRRWSSER
jgi:hypothetical protein